jgi:hypothetical protein
LISRYCAIIGVAASEGVLSAPRLEGSAALPLSDTEISAMTAN